MRQVSAGGEHIQAYSQFAAMANITAHTVSLSELQPRFKIAQLPLWSLPWYLLYSYIICTSRSYLLLHATAQIAFCLLLSFSYMLREMQWLTWKPIFTFSFQLTWQVAFGLKLFNKQSRTCKEIKRDSGFCLTFLDVINGACWQQNPFSLKITTHVKVVLVHCSRFGTI